MPCKTKNNFRQASNDHCASVRFIIAGLYPDAILSIIEGLSKLQIELDIILSPPDVKDSIMVNRCSGSQDRQDIVIDRTPLDRSPVTHMELIPVVPPRTDLGCPSCNSVASVMMYNLALAYHLNAISDDTKPDYYHQLDQALQLYDRAERMLFKYDDDLHSQMPRSSLECNVRHVRHAISLCEQHNLLKKEEYVPAI
eukprot:scaffold4844_cov112-Cylindrotheca_fusiformis.AAC.3